MLHYSPGTTQKQRFLASLLPEGVLLDNKSQAEYLAFASEYSEYLNYYDNNNVIDGTWEPFFSKNVIFNLSIVAITSYKLQKEKLEHEAIAVVLKNLSGKSKTDKDTASRIVFHRIYDIANRINKWYSLFSSSSEKTDFYYELESAIGNNLNCLLKNLKEYWESQYKKVNLDYLSYNKISFEKFSPVWHTQCTDDIYKTTRSQTKNPAGEQYDYSLLIDLLWNIDKVQFFLVNKAKEHLEKSLASKSKHPPHAALYITFLRLYENTRQIVNGFSAKHLDFYYTNILREKPRPLLTDSVEVCFDLAPKIDSYLLPSGSLLSAGKDTDGTEILFSTANDININNVSVSDINTIYFDTDLREKNHVLVKGIFSSSVTPTELKKINNDNKDSGYAQFGEKQFDAKPSARKMQKADNGYAITSPDLLLLEGERTVTITLMFEASSWNAMHSMINDMSHSMYDINNVFSTAFCVYLSGEKEWIQPELKVITDTATKTVSIVLQLTAGDEKIMGYNTKLPGNNFDTIDPVARILYNNNSDTQSFSFISDLIVDKITLSVCVKGFKSLLLSNSYGKLDSTKPFQPFGPAPVQGSYLVIGSEEMIKKNVTHAAFSIFWFGLPPTGFAEYYKDYTNPDITGNSSVQIKLEVLDNGKWVTPVDETKSYPLFHSLKDDDGPASSTTDIPELKIDFAPDYNSTVPLEYKNTSRNGFLRLVITKPNSGFGQSLFASSLSNVISKNTSIIINKAKEDKDEHDPPSEVQSNFLYPLPNTPFVPVMQSISIDYKTSSIIDFTDNTLSDENFCFFKINPFCHYKIATVPGMSGSDVLNIHPVSPFGLNDLVEHVKAHDEDSNFNTGTNNEKQIHDVYSFYKQGNFYLGLTNVMPPQVVTVLLQLTSPSGTSARMKPPVIQWQYLSDNTWKDFPDELKPEDGTNRFLNIGIISISLPSDINSDNLIMPQGLYWIRLSVSKVTLVLSKIVSIQTQAVKATRVVADGQVVLDIGKLPPGTVNKFKNNIKQIKKLTQPLYSFGGRLAESRNEFYTRVSERLRHKQRAITPWDYEHLILQRFSSLYYVRCLSHTKIGNLNAPGNVLIVVIPNVDETTLMNPYAPKEIFRVLYHIRNYIVKYTSPFVTVDVVNPTYNYLKIICDVVLDEDNRDPGLQDKDYIQLLNTDICKYLSPWINDNNISHDVTKPPVSMLDILNFIENRPYIKATTRFSTIQILEDDEVHFPKEDKQFISEDKPWHIIASVDKHLIKVVPSSMQHTGTPVIQAAGINDLQIGSDFKIVNDNN